VPVKGGEKRRRPCDIWSRAEEVGEEQGSRQSRSKTSRGASRVGCAGRSASWVGVGHVGRVVLAGLARNRKEEARDGLGRG
jgi:hypothetical protein